jgi:hypothetical protein
MKQGRRLGLMLGRYSTYVIQMDAGWRIEVRVQRR